MIRDWQYWRSLVANIQCKDISFSFLSPFCILYGTSLQYHIPALLPKKDFSMNFLSSFSILISVSCYFLWWFHDKTCLVILSLGLFNVSPTSTFFAAVLVPLVLSQFVMFDHFNLSSVRRHLLMNTCNFLVFSMFMTHMRGPV